jgi:fructose-1,6-bisphosphatase II / sedoheptulose-1,7-bisphosphatase
MLHAPDVYMDKLAIGPGYPEGRGQPRHEPRRTGARRWPRPRAAPTVDITVCVLERPRHEEMIAELRSTGAAIRLITDGDVAGVIHCAEAEITGIDMYMGSGGAPEGVLAAGAEMHGRADLGPAAVPQRRREGGRAEKAGITDLDRIYTRDDMVTST